MSTAVTAKPNKVRRAPKWLLAAPSWAWYLLFFVVPLGFVVFYSFGYKPPVGSSKLVGTDRLSFDNYRDALTGDLWSTFKNTMQVAILGTILCLVIAFPVAYFLAVKASARWKGLLLGLVIVPFWTSFLIRTIAWRIVLAPKGFFSNWFQDIGLRDTPLRILDTRPAVQIGVVYNYLPLMIFPLFVALDRLDPALREASKDLGAGRIKTFLQVTVPLAMPGIIAGLLLVFIPLSGDYITARVLGGAKGNMVGATIADRVFSAQNQPLGSAIAVVLILSILVVITVAAVIGLAVRRIGRLRRAVNVPDELTSGNGPQSTLSGAMA
jgi:spermidine/putrescine transport system permease protein